MNTEKKILIISVLNHLKEKDPVWGHANMQAKFKDLYAGWAATCMRHHWHNKVYFSRKWRDGWLPWEEYVSFFKYAMQ